MTRTPWKEKRRRVWIASAGGSHRVASRGMLHVSCQIDVPCCAIATIRLMQLRGDGTWPVFVAANDPRVTSLPLTCTGQQLGACTIPCYASAEMQRLQACQCSV